MSQVELLLEAEELEQLRCLEAWLGRAFSSSNPSEVLAQAAVDPALPQEQRAWFGKLDARGVLLSQRIILRLRFERVMQGSLPAKQWFERDPAGFTQVFRSYVQAVPPADPFPTEEALAFHRFVGQAT